jgi:uncharacterized protein (UPF0297 family)
MSKIAGARWSQSLKSWHIPDTNANRLRCGFLPTHVEADNDEIKQTLIEVYNKIQLKAYSNNTAKNYLLHLREYFETIIKKYEKDKVTLAIVEKYLLMEIANKTIG